MIYSKKNQRGLATVEFAIVGAVFFLVLFAILEFGRLLFTWNTLAEVTRQGARQAVVCPFNHSSITNAALFNDSNILPDLSDEDIQIQYLDMNGNVTTDSFSIRNNGFVRVSIAPDVEFSLLIPGLDVAFTFPGFATTLPVESLGLSRYNDAAQCNGTES